MHAHILYTFAYVSAASAASPAPTQPSMKEAALRAASTKGGGRLRRPPPFVDSFVDGCEVAVQVENFVLPKPAVGTEGQASKISKFEPCLFQPSSLK